MRGNVRHVDLENRFLLAFLGHGQRRQQRRKKGHGQYVNSRTVKFLRRAARVVPQPDRGGNGLRASRSRVFRVVRANDLRRIARDDLRRILVRSIDQNLHGSVFAARDLASIIFRDDQRATRFVGSEGLFRLFVRGPRGDVEAQRLAKGIDQFLGSLRLIEVLHDDGKIAHGQRDSSGLQQQQYHGEQERQHHRQAVAKKLRQFFLGLRENSPHDLPLYSSAPILPRSRACSTTLMNTSSSEKRPSRASSTWTPPASSLCVFSRMPASTP